MGGYFAKKYGGKIIFGTGIAITAAFTVVTPWLASASVYLLLAARIIEGFAEVLSNNVFIIKIEEAN